MNLLFLMMSIDICDMRTIVPSDFTLNNQFAFGTGKIFDLKTD